MNQIIIHIHYDISDTDFADSQVIECYSLEDAKIVIENFYHKVNFYKDQVLYDTTKRLSVFSRHNQCREDLIKYIQTKELKHGI